MSREFKNVVTAWAGMCCMLLTLIGCCEGPKCGGCGRPENPHKVGVPVKFKLGGMEGRIIWINGTHPSHVKVSYVDKNGVYHTTDEIHVSEIVVIKQQPTLAPPEIALPSGQIDLDDKPVASVTTPDGRTRMIPVEVLEPALNSADMTPTIRKNDPDYDAMVKKAIDENHGKGP